MNRPSFSKVRLGLAVNGLYLICLLTPSPPHDPHGPYAHEYEGSAVRPVRGMPPAGNSLSSPPGGLGVKVSEADGLIDVSLSGDIMLVESRGHTLSLSPSFSVPARPSAEFNILTSVRLRFLLFSNRRTCAPDDCPLTITADGVTLWPERLRDGTLKSSTGWERESFPPSSTRLDDGRVVETVAAESLTMKIPYELFKEITRARKVAIGLGTNRVTLTPDQIEVLRKMHLLFPEPSPDGSSSRF